MNYFEYSTALLNKTYIYIDTQDYISNQIFIDNNICVDLINALANENTDYRIMFVKIKKNKENIFIKCMNELYDKILLDGHLDYIDVCDSIIGKMNKEKQKVAKKV